MFFLASFFLVSILFYSTYVCYVAYFFAKDISSSQEKINDKSVSIIIPARNEEKYIKQTLQSVLNQTYPKNLLEIILIDDHSMDKTKEIAQKIAIKNSRLKILDLKKEGINSYKKAAITQGISHSNGEIIIQTDADCIVPPTWVSEIVSQFQEGIVFISGPVQLLHGKSWLEKFQALEFMGLIGLGGGAMQAGIPTMCNGANMAYRRSAFEDISGFEGVDHIASGDDELLMQKMRKVYPSGIKFVKRKGAIVQTYALPSWKALRTQRIRWVSKARFYHNRWTNIVQLIFYFAFLSFPFFFVAGIWDANYWKYLLGASLIKLITDMVIMVPAAKFFHKLRLLNYLVPMQPFYILYVLWIGVAGNFVRNYSWKERKVR